MKIIYKIEYGFTLVELMVVVSILAILFTIGATIFSSSQIRSRDNKRIGDVKSLEVSLEQYYSDQNTFPSTNSVTGGTQLKKGTTIYLNQIPQDPNGTNYIYQPVNLVNPLITCDENDLYKSCNFYCIFVKLEKPIVGFRANPKCTLPPSYNYEVDSQSPNNS